MNKQGDARTLGLPGGNAFVPRSCELFVEQKSHVQSFTTILFAHTKTTVLKPPIIS